ncbi:MAG TPA: heme exporter protein CcmD [Acidimicrobiia bacterium]|nr:heme exporter protein CcmD [Acidimicrobiia bacterium]
MDENWGYVVVGYALTGVSLAAYVGWIWTRTRRARRSLPDTDG